MSKDDLVYVKDIYDCIVKIDKFLDAISLEDFAGNDEKQDAVIRNYEVMGEAVSRIKNEYKLANANVPWRNIKSMRNFLIHNYDEVDIKLIYKSAKKDLTPLKSALEILLNANTKK
jgi:uncharacterized protein with HEPN domain